MKAPDFQYCCPQTIDEVCELLQSHGSDARILAGGQSLVPAMNLRLSSAELLIDINRVEALEGISLSEDGTYVRVGALARHAQVAASALIAKHVPLVHNAMKYVAHPAIRNRGTCCGSLALADPSAEMPACAVTLNATLVLQSKQDGVREVPAREFFFGLYDTARRDDEILIEVRWPCRTAGSLSGFDELSRRHGDFAMVGIAVQGRMASGLIDDLSLVTFGTGPVPRLSARAGELAQGQRPTPQLAQELAVAAAGELDPDEVAEIEIRRYQATALARRVLSKMFQEADDAG
ncbi:FAD binding domain-containing protein [Pusillimonas noertemannii]|uniref:Carbon-monoxide dehydrogenase medium subunit n=1 Tax=Pusillimonas noertemannii TaxID=305977 RepID=A0A2U1CPT3_9BURK|nr:FAD binding domain-containing protein [Pusillimonas noertemannii]NYT67146.1 FAD binding domain-containing protein [Pusillimonas noertemannii]PVY67821.1 carbon-monoxide dehydrogenase medium subunit [Pusillimonas noertemannii]TFL12652.1 xanthine dehydrogenase family protein subunit M [Pusillimonas noertemannii]